MAKSLKSKLPRRPPPGCVVPVRPVPGPNPGEALSRTTQILFLIFVAYTACPIIEVPGLLVVIRLDPFVYCHRDFFSGSLVWCSSIRLDYPGWVFLGGYSAVAGGEYFPGEGVAIDLDNWKYVLRYAYWMVAFVMTIYVVSTARLGPRVVKAITWAIL